MATTLYCSDADLVHQLTQDGADLRATQAVRDECRAEASREVDGYCLLFYEEAQLALSPWIKYRAKAIACMLVCELTSEPPPSSTARKYDKAIKDLEKVQAGETMIPEIPMRVEAAPTLGNVHIRNWPVPHTRVDKSRSTSGTPEHYTQKGTLVDPIDFTI